MNGCQVPAKRVKQEAAGSQRVLTKGMAANENKR